ncbi:MAG: GAF domain-containing protein [Chloroflexota bacterium]|nr:GAF domain-containing protein [Chloroflexota bacterium]
MSEPTERPSLHAGTIPAVTDLLAALTRSTVDVKAVLQTFTERAIALVGADAGSVHIRHEDGYRVVAFGGMSPEFELAHDDRDFVIGRGSVVGRVLMTGETVHVEDVLADPEYELRDLQRVGGYRTTLGVPMVRDGEAIGVLAVLRMEVAPFSPAEIDVVSLFAGHAAIALRVAELMATIERQRTELARFAPQVATLLSSKDGEQLLAGHRREITALFCDLRGFTAFAETAEPEELLGVLRDYHATVGALALQHAGTVEHFAGDGLMVFFNDPAPIPDHGAAAVRAALAIRDAFGELSQRWRRRGYELGLGIGLAIGYATLGRIGFEGRYDYGGVGNVVILASRLSDIAADGEILVSQRLAAVLEDRFVTEAREPTELKGMTRPVTAYAVLGAAPGE